jgi:hypothetical protein
MTKHPTNKHAEILWSIVWAIALVAAAFVFKHSPALNWVEGTIFVAAITHVLWNARCRPRCW